MNASILLASVLLVMPAHAADYKPVRCDVARPYAGAPLRAPPGAEELTISGELGGKVDEATAARLQSAFDQAMAATKAKSMTAAVATPGKGMWSTEGTAEGGAPAAPLHYWASAGKVFTALAVLKLIEEGKLSLHDSVAKFIPGVPNGRAITVEMLLDHTSGLFSVNEDLIVRRERKRLTLQESLRVLNEHGAMFCPGEQWRYTNTGYDLLGRIVEVVEQRPFDEAVTQRIVAPLRLPHLRILRGDDPATDIAPLSSSNPQEPSIDPRIPGAAGPLAAKAEDVVKFWHALLSDRIVSRATRERMFARLYPMFGKAPYYGLGVMVYDVAADNGELHTWIGHSGGAPGVKAMFAYSPYDRAFVAVALSGDGSAEATANLLVRALSTH